MILKERDERKHSPSDKFGEAGAKAEEQMAFYLSRAFEYDTEVRVFNDLRFVDNYDDVVQIDHLILHHRGIIIIESKSVTSEVRINQRAEWARVWNGRLSGMPSPILQAHRQGERLKFILTHYAEQLRGKMLGAVQKRFGACPFEVLVAISDSGVVHREMELPEVFKADQIVDQIRAIIHKHNRAAFLPTNLSDGADHFPDEEMENISNFFLQHHHHGPVKKQTVYPTADEREHASHVRETSTPSVPPPSDLASPITQHGLGVCQKCGTQSEILWGKFGYYWKCTSCESNTPIKEFCPICREKLKLRKDKEKFFKHCDRCNTESLYYNAVSQPRPIEHTKAEPPRSRVEVPVSHANDLGVCPKCKMQSEILWGKYGYYWKCKSCDSNTPIKEFCPSCRDKMKLRKDKNRFFKYCEPCKTESLYHEAR